MFDRILVPLDGSTLAECVLPHAVTLARACDAQLALMHVAESGSEEGQPEDPVSWHLRRAEAQSYLEAVAGRVLELGTEVDQIIQEGRPAARIVDFVREQSIPLVILSSHGRHGLSSWSAGSTTLEVALRAHVSTMIVPAYRPELESPGTLQYRRLFLPMDGSQRAECIVSPANALADPDLSQQLAVHVLSTPYLPGRPASTLDAEPIGRFRERARAAALSYLEQLSPRLQGNVQRQLLVDDRVAARLKRVAIEEDVDLILMSAHGHGGNNRWPFGSVALHFIIYGVPCPLLVVQDFDPHEIAPTPAERAVAERKGH